jgi:hypothetical protein
MRLPVCVSLIGKYPYILSPTLRLLTSSPASVTIPTVMLPSLIGKPPHVGLRLSCGLGTKTPSFWSRIFVEKGERPRYMVNEVPCFSADKRLLIRTWLGFRGGSSYSLITGVRGATAISSLGIFINPEDHYDELAKKRFLKRNRSALNRLGEVKVGPFRSALQ